MSHPAVSTPKQSDFLAVPERPLVYWLSDHLLYLNSKPRASIL
jgi:hypothetical protein